MHVKAVIHPEVVLQLDGAASVLVGVAANEFRASGRVVVISELFSLPARERDRTEGNPLKASR